MSSADELFDTVAPGLVGRDQWICWRNECRDCGNVHDPEHKTCPDCDGEMTKRPINPETGGFAKSDDPTTWASLETAAEFYFESDAHGAGFMFSEDGQIMGIDLDGCRDPETGEVDEWAQEIITMVRGPTEISPSGTGFHIYVYGEVPEGGNRRDGVEMYDSHRYFTVTGDHVGRTPTGLAHRQDEIEAVHSGHINTGAGAGGSEIVDFDLDIPRELEEETFTNDLGETLEEIRDRDGKLDRLLEELEGEYDSPSEADMAAVSKLWFWRFDRQTIGKILRTHRRRPKVIERDDYLELTISKAATGDQRDPRPQGDFDVEILEDRELYDSVEEATRPDINFVLIKPPREGGSHWLTDVLSDDPIVTLVSRHAIADQHLGKLANNSPDDAAAVHLVGRHRACDHAGEDECPNVCTSREDRNRLEHEAMNILHRKSEVTADDCPPGFCKSQFIKFCAEKAHAVVTVPQLLPRIERDFSDHNILIDEEQALAHFRPDSVSIVEITERYEPDGSKQIQVVSSPINNQFDAFETIREDIREEQEKRKEEAEAEDRDWRRTSWEIDIINAIEYLEEVKGVLGVSALVEEMEEEGATVSIKAVMDELRDRLSEIDRPEPHTDPNEFREKLSEYTAQFYHDDSADPGSYIESTLFPYEDKPFDFKHAGPGYRLRMIGGRQIFNADLLREFAQIGLIAGPEGELLLDDLDVDAKAIEIEEFRYADDFMVVPVAKYRDDSPEDPRDQRDRARRVSEHLNRAAHPHMGVAGTKERAESHHSELSEGLADVIANPDSPSKDIYTAWSSGQTAIIYANSAISRGVDAPPFDISVVLSSEFAKPYWEARKSHLLDEHGADDDRFHEAAAIEAELKANELTNAVLRPAPTPYIDDYYGTKYIVVSEFDVPRLKYLQDNVLPRFAYADKAANFLQEVTVGGGLRVTIDDIYDEVGGDERKFIEVASKESFTEAMHNRPSFEYDRLESWVDNWYLTKGGVTERVIGVLARMDEPTTKEIKTQLPGLPDGEVYAAMNALKQKGIITSRKENPDGPGEPPTRWSVDK